MRDAALLKLVTSNFNNLVNFFSRLYLGQLSFINAEQAREQIGQQLSLLTSVSRDPLLTAEQHITLHNMVIDYFPRMEILNYHLPVDAALARVGHFFSVAAIHDVNDENQQQAIAAHWSLLDSLSSDWLLTTTQRQAVQQIVAALPEGYCLVQQVQQVSRFFESLRCDTLKFIDQEQQAKQISKHLTLLSELLSDSRITSQQSVSLQFLVQSFSSMPIMQGYDCRALSFQYSGGRNTTADRFFASQIAAAAIPLYQAPEVIATERDESEEQPRKKMRK